jgi:hypothetical protein
VRNNFSDQLRTTDPVVHEPGLSETEIQVMRRAIAAAATDTRQARWLPWRPGLAAALAFVVVAGAFIARVFEPRQESAQPQATEQRQLQFETPGGTRVVWVLNSKFDLPEDRHQ